jgi:hypothetical protein
MTLARRLAILALPGALLAAGPFWLDKPPAQWTGAELTEMLTDSPWAQWAGAPGRASPVLVFLATAAPMRLAEQERDRRARLKRPAADFAEADELAAEYRAWLEDQRGSQIILAVRAENTRAFAQEREVRRMEEESVMRAGRRRIKMTGHFPPSSADPYLRLAFPRAVSPADKSLAFDLYLPGVSAPYRSVEFDLRTMLVRGTLEL